MITKKPETVKNIDIPFDQLFTNLNMSTVLINGMDKQLTLNLTVEKGRKLPNGEWETTNKPALTLNGKMSEILPKSPEATVCFTKIQAAFAEYYNAIGI